MLSLATPNCCIFLFLYFPFHVCPRPPSFLVKSFNRIDSIKAFIKPFSLHITEFRVNCTIFHPHPCCASYVDISRLFRFTCTYFSCPTVFSLQTFFTALYICLALSIFSVHLCFDLFYGLPALELLLFSFLDHHMCAR